MAETKYLSGPGKKAGTPFLPEVGSRVLGRNAHYHWRLNHNWGLDYHHKKIWGKFSLFWFVFHL